MMDSSKSGIWGQLYQYSKLKSKAKQSLDLALMLTYLNSRSTLPVLMAQSQHMISDRLQTQMRNYFAYLTVSTNNLMESRLSKTVLILFVQAAKVQSSFSNANISNTISTEFKDSLALWMQLYIFAYLVKNWLEYHHHGFWRWVHSRCWYFTQQNIAIFGSAWVIRKFPNPVFVAFSL